LREELTSHLSQLASSEEQLAEALREVARMAERAAKSEALESQIDMIVEEKVRMKERIVDLEKRCEANGTGAEKSLNRTLNELQRKLESTVKENEKYVQSLASYRMQQQDADAQLTLLEDKLRLAEQMPVMGTAAHVSPRGGNAGDASVFGTSKGKGNRKPSKTGGGGAKGLKSADSTNSVAELMKLKADQRSNRANQIESIIKKGRAGR
jgi:hypothetical protein